MADDTDKPNPNILGREKVDKKQRDVVEDFKKHQPLPDDPVVVALESGFGSVVDKLDNVFDKLEDVESLIQLASSSWYKLDGILETAKGILYEMTLPDVPGGEEKKDDDDSPRKFVQEESDRHVTEVTPKFIPVVIKDIMGKAKEIFGSLFKGKKTGKRRYRRKSEFQIFLERTIRDLGAMIPKLAVAVGVFLGAMQKYGKQFEEFGEYYFQQLKENGEFMGDVIWETWLNFKKTGEFMGDMIWEMWLGFKEIGEWWGDFLWDTWKGAKEKWAVWNEWWGEQMVEFGDLLKVSFNVLWNIMKWPGEKIGELLIWIHKLWKSPVDAIGDLFNNVGRALTAFLDTIKNILSIIPSRFLPEFARNWASYEMDLGDFGELDEDEKRIKRTQARMLRDKLGMEEGEEFGRRGLQKLESMVRDRVEAHRLRQQQELEEDAIAPDSPEVDDTPSTGGAGVGLLRHPGDDEVYSRLGNVMEHLTEVMSTQQQQLAVNNMQSRADTNIHLASSTGIDARWDSFKLIPTY